MRIFTKDIVVALCIVATTVSCVSMRKPASSSVKRANISQTATKRATQSVSTTSTNGANNVTVVKSDSGTTYITDVQIGEDGEKMSVIGIEEIVVTSSFKSIPERFGSIKLEFMVSVPKELQRERWRIILTPVLRQGDSTMRLDPVVLRGETMELMQRRRQWQHEKYLNRVAAKTKSMADDTLHRRLNRYVSRKEFFADRLDDTRRQYVERVEFFNGKAVKSGSLYTQRRERFAPQQNTDADKYASFFEKQPSEQLVERLTPLSRQSMLADVSDRFMKSPLRQAWSFMNVKRIEARSKDMLASYKIDNARVDSLVTTPRNVNYFYSQEFKTDENTLRMTLALEGYAQDLRGRKAEIPKSDTLTYSVTSMINFIDHAPRYVYNVVSKYATVNDVSWITFPLGKSAIIDTLANNRVELEKMTSLMNSLLYQYEFYVDSVIITAASSPEGSVVRNEALSRDRAHSIRNYLVSKFNKDVDTLIKVRWIGEDWKRLGQLVKKDSRLANRDNIASVIASTANPDARDAIIAKSYPEDFKIIKDELYPSLRSVNFKYSLRRVGMVQDTVYTTEIDTAYRRGVELLTKRKYVDALRILEPYADINTAIIMMSLGYDMRAIEILETVPQTSNRDYMLAILCSRRGRMAEGLKYFEQAVAVDPRFEHRANLDPEIQALLRYRDRR